MSSDTEQRSDVRLTLVVTLRNGVQLRMGIKDAKIGQDRATGRLTGINWTLDEDPLGTSIGWVDVSEVVAVHYERESALANGNGKAP
jgi:hypothetical protein